MKDLGLLNAAERAQSVGEASAARSHARGATLHELFERQVARTPQAIALTGFGAMVRSQISYAELNRRANALAHELRELGVGANHWSGCAPSAMPNWSSASSASSRRAAPTCRWTRCTRRSASPSCSRTRASRVVLTAAQPARRSGDPAGVTVICLDEPRRRAQAMADVNPPAAVAADDLAYVIYTSGSTGKPKGALITHDNVARLFDATDAWFGFDERDVWTLFHSYAFDFSVWELWGALLYGGRLVVVPYWMQPLADGVPRAAGARARHRAQPDALRVPPADRRPTRARARRRRSRCAT